MRDRPISLRGAQISRTTLPARFDPERYAQREQRDHADAEGLEHRSVGGQPALLGLLVNLSQSLVPEKGRINPDGQQRPDATNIERDRVIESAPHAVRSAGHYCHDGDHYSDRFTGLHINRLLAGDTFDTHVEVIEILRSTTQTAEAN